MTEQISTAVHDVQCSLNSIEHGFGERAMTELDSK
jgi:hypothetical protein